MNMTTTTSTPVDNNTPPQDVAIEVRDLIKRYPKASFNAVDGITFSVKRGEIFGLLGPNGAGKTTTIGVLTTGVRPTSGAARIAGIDVVADPMSIKQRIAVVPQQSNLDRSLRAREILTFHASYHGMSRAERNARANALLAELGLGDRAKDSVARYSGGMAQRLMLARALMHSPDVLFLDEPTNSLDPQSRLFLWDRIQLLREQGVTILLTTHDMEEADQLCDRIAIMDHGHILVLNTAEELKKLVPGGSTLELKVSIPEPATVGAESAQREMPAHMLETLRALPDVRKVDEVTDDGEEGAHDLHLFRVYAENPGALMVPVTQAIAELDGSIELRDLRLFRPSLEDVFIYLTGRNLR
jgi:ABC-2 type transport system ATP-binding protein